MGKALTVPCKASVHSCTHTIMFHVIKVTGKVLQQVFWELKEE